VRFDYCFRHGDILAMVLWDVMTVSFGCDMNGGTQSEGERDVQRSDCEFADGLVMDMYVVIIRKQRHSTCTRSIDRLNSCRQ
jgi:hypothetical protein